MENFTGPPWRVRLHLSYDGTGFHGWQKQPHTTATIQGQLEGALSKIFNSPIRLIGAGRTDAGVHAVEQVAHFDAPKDPRRYRLAQALQGLLPPSIVCKDSWLCPQDFHALHSSTYKTYRYVILNRPCPSALRGRYTWWQTHPLALEKLNELSQVLIGTKDFRSFQTSGTHVPHTVREIISSHWSQRPGMEAQFEITGSGFLKQMVRNIVGTLIDLHRKDESCQTLVEILDAKDRKMALSTAPACGLHLYRVYYPQELDNRCRKL